MTVFTDQEAVVAEAEYLANSTGQAHAIVRAGSGERHRWRVVSAIEVGRRKPLVVCEPAEEVSA